MKGLKNKKYPNHYHSDSKSALLFSVLAGIKSKNWQKLRRLEKKLGFALLAKFGNRIKQIASF